MPLFVGWKHFIALNRSKLEKLICRRSQTLKLYISKNSLNQSIQRLVKAWLCKCSSPWSSVFFLKSSRHWRLPGFSSANLLLRYQNRRVMRMMKRPMAVRIPSTSGETETQKVKLFGIFEYQQCTVQNDCFSFNLMLMILLLIVVLKTKTNYW